MSSRWKKVLYDFETDGLLETVSKIWCCVIMDLETQEVASFGPHYEGPGGIIEAVRLLDNADLHAGHNIIDYDARVARKLFPWARMRPPTIRDTLLLSRWLSRFMANGNFKDNDFKLAKSWGMPLQLAGRHSLEAWGYRLGLHKIDYKDWCKERGLDPWAEWRQEMTDYCVGDVQLNYRVLNYLAKYAPPKKAMDLEMAYREWAIEMETNGAPFDKEKAQALTAVLVQRKAELHTKVAAMFEDWYAPISEGGVSQFTVPSSRKVKVPGLGSWQVRPKAGPSSKGKTLKGDLDAIHSDNPPGDNLEWAKAQIAAGIAVEFVPVFEHWDKGAVYTKIERRQFNPTSRDHIADRLQKLYGWKPVEFGKGNKPTLDDDILADLPYPPCKLLAEYFMIDKRLAMVCTGGQGWLKLAKETEVHGRTDCRIHGKMDQFGTVTDRVAHSKPNTGQVPSVENGEGIVPYGKECREMWRAERGMVLMGCDAAGIQLRSLGHNLYEFDGGIYGGIVSSGDVHTANMIAAGLPTRSVAKRFIYAFLFGAGGWKLGSVSGGATPEEIALWTPGAPFTTAALKHLEGRGLPATPENIVMTIKGFAYKSAFMKRTPGLKDLMESIQEQAAQGFIVALDGRKIAVRSPHSALNFLLQSDEAIICKAWKVMWFQEMLREGFKHGRDFVIHLDVHDEFQASVLEKHSEDIGKLAVSCIARTGEAYGYKVPLTGEYKIGTSWYGTH